MNKITKSVNDFSNGGFMRTFLLKAKHFFKRNIYPITVTMCTVLVLGIITISAYTSIKNNNEVVQQTTNPIIGENEQVTDNPNDDIETGANAENKPSEPAKPVTPKIVFEQPVDNSQILKNYTDSSLIYDKTTDMWCTHQAIDFSAIEGQDVKAVYDGVVVKVESSMMYGTVIYLKVSDELTVVYKGLSSDVQIKEGDQIKKGAVIGKITSFLAEKSDGIHLHLELLKSGKLANINEYFK